MSINLYKKKTINNQPVLEELLSKSTDTVDNKPLVYDSTTDNVKSADNLNVNSVTASCFHGPLDGTAKNATCFDNKTYAEACADILSGCAADSNKLNGKTYSEVCSDILSGCAADSNKLNGKTYAEVCSDILSGTAANATCFSGKTCTEWKDIIKTTCVDNAALATNATCFNGCTYSEACTDIRNGLATQACADAIQNCADFIQSCVSAIESKIPAQASASNQLADKDFVNSSITTNTANFRGTYACVAELPTAGNTNNDYAFVCSLNTTTGNYIYDRYKWVASDSCWVCEYEINTTGFTAEQLASINSGITDTLVAKITDVYDNTVTICMNDECKGSFNLNQNTDVCIDLGNTIRNANCAGYATYASQASEATNATKFDNKTYNEAYADIRTGTVRAVKIGTSTAVTPDGTGLVCLPAYPPDLSSCDGLDCTGTVTQVKVGETAYDPVSGVVSLPAYPVIPTTIQNATCFNGCTYACAKADILSGCAADSAKLGNKAASCYIDTSSTTQTKAGNLKIGAPAACTSTSAGGNGLVMHSLGTISLYKEGTPYIDFHYDRYCGGYSSRICNSYVSRECRGSLDITVNNGTGCTTCTECANYCFKSDGTFTGASKICASTNVYSAGCPVVTTGTLPTVAPGYNCTGTSNYVVTTMVCCAKQVCRNATQNNTACHLALFSYNTSASTSLYVSSCCPLTYNPATGILTAAFFSGTATNADCFGGCTYAQACTNIRSGLTGCTGTVTSVNVSVNGCSGTAVTTSGTVTLTNVPTCKIYKIMATAFCNRNVLLGEVTEAAGYGNVYVGNCCKLTFNPATGVLCAKCFCGSVTASGQIDCAIAIKRYQATSGECHIALFNGNTAIDSACAYVSSSCPLTFNPATGELRTKGGAVFGYAVKGYCNGIISDACRTWHIGDNGLAQFRFAYICGPLSLGAQCDICIRDYCNNDFICGRCNNLTIGYNSCDFEENFNCCRITVGLANYMCPGTNCGDSVVVGYNNYVCWPSYSNLSLIYGNYNITSDGGLAVGGWNRACGECSVVLGWDSVARECSISIGVGAYTCGLYSIAIGCDTCVCGDKGIAIGCESCSYVCNGISIGTSAKTECIGRIGTTETFGCVLSDIHRGDYRDVAIHSSSNIMQCELYEAIADRIDLSKDLATQCICTIPDINCSLLVRGRYNNLGITSIQHQKYSGFCNLILTLSDNSRVSIGSVGSNLITAPIYIELTGLSV